MSLTSYDYIVVGAGAAGCVVASRLSANPATSVLLLEAGGRDWSPLIHMPVGFTKLTSPAVNWGFETVPQKQLNNRAMWYPQGRTLGGSTSINAMIYIRGQREDYDGWAALGNDDWGYEQVLPFFRRAERNERLGGEFQAVHGTRHVDVSQHHSDVRALLKDANRLVGVSRFQGAEPRLLCNFDRQHADEEVVFDDQENGLRFHGTTLPARAD